MPEIRNAVVGCNDNGWFMAFEELDQYNIWHPLGDRLKVATCLESAKAIAFVQMHEDDCRINGQPIKITDIQVQNSFVQHLRLDDKYWVQVCTANGGTIRSNLKVLTGEDSQGNDLDPTGNGLVWNATIDGLESLLLALACAGLDVSKYTDAIMTAVDGISNNLD